MTKKLYYIKVGSGEILPEKTMAEYELTIEATPDDVDHLESLFKQIDQEATNGFIRAHIPFIQYHHDSSNDHYDEIHTEIYQFIYQRGTPTTKSHIESIGILKS